MLRFIDHGVNKDISWLVTTVRLPISLAFTHMAISQYPYDRSVIRPHLTLSLYNVYLSLYFIFEDIEPSVFCLSLSQIKWSDDIVTKLL